MAMSPVEWTCVVDMDMCSGTCVVDMDMCSGTCPCALVMSMCAGHVHVRWSCPCVLGMAMYLNACPCYLSTVEWTCVAHMDMCLSTCPCSPHMSMCAGHGNVRWSCPCALGMAMYLSACPCYLSTVEWTCVSVHVHVTDCIAWTLLTSWEIG